MKQWLIALLGAIIGAILMYVFIPEQLPVVVNDRDYEGLKAQNESLISDLFFSQMTVDSLQYVIDIRATSENRLKKEVTAYKKILNDSTMRIKELASEILALRSVDHKDSLADELANRAEIFTSLYIEYRDKYDSLTVISDSTRQDLEAQKAVLTSMVADLKIANLNLFNSFTKLVADDQKLMQSLIRQKLKTKVVALLGIIGTGAALLK